MVVPAKNAFGGVFRGLSGAELVGVGVTGGRVSAGAGGFVLGVEDRVEVVGLARVPLAPARGVNMRAHLGIEEDDGSIGAPWPAQEDVALAGLGDEAAMIEDEGGLLFGRYLPCAVR